MLDEPSPRLGNSLIGLATGLAVGSSVSRAQQNAARTQPEPAASCWRGRWPDRRSEVLTCTPLLISRASPRSGSNGWTHILNSTSWTYAGHQKFKTSYHALTSSKHAWGRVSQTENRENSEDPGAESETLLDVKGLNCPMPLLKAKKALNGLSPGALLRVIATDPGSERDFETFSAQSGHALLSFERQGDDFIYLLRKKDA